MLSTAVLQIFQQRCREWILSLQQGMNFANNSTFTFDLTMRKSGFRTFGSFPFRPNLARLQTNKILLMKQRREFITHPGAECRSRLTPEFNPLSRVDFYNFGFQSPVRPKDILIKRPELLLWTRPAVLSCERVQYSIKNLPRSYFYSRAKKAKSDPSSSRNAQHML